MRPAHIFNLGTGGRKLLRYHCSAKPCLLSSISFVFIWWFVGLRLTCLYGVCRTEIDVGNYSWPAAVFWHTLTCNVLLKFDWSTVV